MDADVITIDSDNEDDYSSTATITGDQPDNGGGGGGGGYQHIVSGNGSLMAAISATPRSPARPRLPLPSGLIPAATARPLMNRGIVPTGGAARGRGGGGPGSRGGGATAKQNKRPGQFPPFALFSQEQRPLLQQRQPSLNFGELGKMLGEMWHGLTEDQKEDYRRRAREVQAKKLKEWEKNQAVLRARAQKRQQQMQQLQQQVHQQQQQQVNRGIGRGMVITARGGAGASRLPTQFVGGSTGRGVPPPRVRGSTLAQVGRGAVRYAPIQPRPAASAAAPQQAAGHQPPQPHQRRRKTHGYAVFSAERRKYYTNLGLDFNQSTQRTAEEWRNASLKVKQNYELKARKINQMHEQRMMQQAGGMGPSRASTAAAAASSSLRISSVSSLSASHHQQQQQQQGSNINLPNSISISRVEPEISIVSETAATGHQLAPAAAKPRQLPASTQLTRQLNANSRITLVQQQQLNPNRLVTPQMAGLQQQGRIIRPAGFSGPLKRSAPAPLPAQGIMGHSQVPQMAGPAFPAAKRQRFTGPRVPLINSAQAAFQLERELGLGQPLNPAQMTQRDKFCRLCAVVCHKAGPMYPLARVPNFVEKIRSCLGVDVDLARDEAEGYPGVVCRKCCQLSSSLIDFKVKVDEGTAKLGRILAMRHQSHQQEQEQRASSGASGGSNVGSPAVVSVGEDEEAPASPPRSGKGEEVSILPDLDMDIDASSAQQQPKILSPSKPVSIKDEKHPGIPTVDVDKAVEEEEKVVDTPAADHEQEESSLREEEKGEKEKGTAVEVESDTGSTSPLAADEDVALGIEDGGEDDGEVDPLNGQVEEGAEGSPSQADTNFADWEGEGDSLTFLQVGECHSIDNDSFENNDEASGDAAAKSSAATGDDDPASAEMDDDARAEKDSAEPASKEGGDVGDVDLGDGDKEEESKEDDDGDALWRYDGPADAPPPTREEGETQGEETKMTRKEEEPSVAAADVAAKKASSSFSAGCEDTDDYASSSQEQSQQHILEEVLEEKKKDEHILEEVLEDKKQEEEEEEEELSAEILGEEAKDSVQPGEDQDSNGGLLTAEQGEEEEENGMTTGEGDDSVDNIEDLLKEDDDDDVGIDDEASTEAAVTGGEAGGE